MFRKVKMVSLPVVVVVTRISPAAVFVVFVRLVALLVVIELPLLVAVVVIVTFYCLKFYNEPYFKRSTINMKNFKQKKSYVWSPIFPCLFDIFSVLFSFFLK